MPAKSRGGELNGQEILPTEEKCQKVAPIPFRLESNQRRQTTNQIHLFQLFFSQLIFFGKSAKKFFVDFIFVFPHPPFEIETNRSRILYTAFNVQLHRCGSFSPHDRVIDSRVMAWASSGMVGLRDWRRQSNCPTAAAAAGGKQKYDDVPATTNQRNLVYRLAPIRPDCFPLPVAHNFVFWWGRVSLFLSNCRSKSAQSSSTTCR